MTYLLVALLLLALLLTARLLWKQDRHLRDLQEAIRSEQVLLDEEGSGHLPAWPPLAAAVNALIRDNAALRRQRTDQLTQLEATLGHLREAVLIVDENNYVHLANRALRDIFPSARGLVNLRLELIVRSADFLEYVRATREGQSRPRQEFEIVEGQQAKWIEASGAPIPSPDGKAQWALFVIHDMTHQRKLERMRRDFVANASHELRTPLSIIKGYVETLVDGHEHMATADRDKFLRTIQRHGERLNAIITDLLTLSRLESATPGLNYVALDLQPYLQGLVDDALARPNAGSHTVQLEASGALGSLQVDEEKLTQVFTNLLDNALKYTPKGSRIELAARALEAGGEVEVTVRDNGPGIPAEDLPHIFERFYRVEKGRSRESGGTGLGLSIVKHIVQLHGGRVWAESEPGRGTAIIVRLPRAPSPVATAAQLKLL
jgi:two-component system phosphate regulon sensor histidine kinase PhoR